MPGSFMGQWWGDVKKQSKKIIQSLQIPPRMASLRQGDVLVSLPYSHFMSGVKWNISCHIRKQRCHSYLQFWPLWMWIFWASPVSSRGAPFATQRIQEGHSPARVDGVRFSPLGRLLCMYKVALWSRTGLPMQETWETRVRSLGQEDPLEEGYFCLENPMDRGAWLATIHSIAKSETWLKQLGMHR